MTTFIEERLSECVAAGFQVVPAYKTGIVESDNGDEDRNQERTKAKRRMAAAWRNFSREEFDDLLEMFHVAGGSWLGFRFKDWTDYQVIGGSLGNAPSGSTPVQLVKVYGPRGGLTRTRIIKKPVAGTITVYQDDGAGNFIEKPGTTDTTAGFFTPTTAWTLGRALRADFEFDIAVRFVSDEFPATFESSQNFITANAELIEDFRA